MWCRHQWRAALVHGGVCYHIVWCATPQLGRSPCGVTRSVPTPCMLIVVRAELHGYSNIDCTLALSGVGFIVLLTCIECASSLVDRYATAAGLIAKNRVYDLLSVHPFLHSRGQLWTTHFKLIHAWTSLLELRCPRDGICRPRV